MKKYKLKQWYPSLPKEWKYKKEIISFNTISNGYKMEGVDGIAHTIGAHEFDNKDFWELIEDRKPLFMTEDKVEMFEGDKFIIVTDNFIKHKAVACNSLHREYKAFKHEFSADEYIMWNKPLFSLQDIDATIKRCLPEFDELIRLVEERLNNNNELVTERFKSRAFDKRANEL